jgi:hypothetical protein
VRRSDGFFRRWELLVPAVLAPVAETAAALIIGPKTGASLGPQLSAPPPFDVFHDLRWISVYHNSWATLALELIAMVVLRSAYVAWILQRTWPRASGAPPSLLAAARRTAVFYALCAVLLSPWVALLFGLAVTHLSYLFFVALPPALAIALAIHRGAMLQALGHWWRWRPSWHSLVWAGAAFLWLTVAGAIVSAGNLPLAIAAAAGAGLLNARAYVGIVHDVLTPRRPVATARRWQVPAALAATFAIVIGGTQVGFTATAPRGATSSSTAGTGIPLVGQGHPVLVVAGYGSRWDPRPVLKLPHGFVAWRYSYRGLDAERRPLPYGPADTLRPLMASALVMGAQVNALSRAYSSPVTIIAESEGAIVARTYLLRVYRPDSHQVDRVVVLDLPTGASSVYYPPHGTEGWGVGSGWALRGLAAIIRGLGAWVPASADAPLLRDMVDCGSLIAGVAGAPPPQGVRQVSIEALADSVDDPLPMQSGGSLIFVVNATHGGLVQRADVQRQIYGLLSEWPSSGARVSARLARLVAAAATPWQTPGLVAGLAPSSPC